MFFFFFFFSSSSSSSSSFPSSLSLSLSPTSSLSFPLPYSTTTSNLRIKYASISATKQPYNAGTRRILLLPDSQRRPNRSASTSAFPPVFTQSLLSFTYSRHFRLFRDSHNLSSGVYCISLSLSLFLLGRA